MGANFDGTQKAHWPNPYNPTGAAITIAAWLKPTTTSGSPYFINLQRAGDLFGFFLWNGAAAGSFQTSRFYSSISKMKRADGAIANDTWQHLIATDTGASTSGLTTIDQYKNGSLLAAATNANGSGTEGAFSGPLMLAGRAEDGLRNYTGRLAEVGVWNRILSSGERDDLAAGKSPLFIPDGLVFYSPLTEADGWIDHISTNTATLVGSPTIVTDHPTIEYPAQFHSPTGGIALGGAPLVEHVTGAWEHAPTGGVALGGAPAVSHVQFHVHVPAGGVALGGAPAIGDVPFHIHVPTGGLALGGAPNSYRFPFIHAPTGGLALGGAPSITRSGSEGVYSIEWWHEREILSVRLDTVVQEHERLLRDLVNGDGVVQVHARAVSDAVLRALASEDLQYPVASGELVVP